MPTTFDPDAINRFEDLDDMPRITNQQQQQQLPPMPRVEVVLCIPDDQRRYLPRRIAMPERIPLQERPSVGEVVRIGDSAWGVAMVIHHWPTPVHHRIEIWLDRVPGRDERPSGFAITQ
jgi:hypothetical protein